MSKSQKAATPYFELLNSTKEVEDVLNHYRECKKHNIERHTQTFKNEKGEVYAKVRSFVTDIDLRCEAYKEGLISQKPGPREVMCW